MSNYLEPQKQEGNHQLTDDELYLRSLRIDAPGSWSAKNGGACAYCGGHDGMVSLRRYMFSDAPPAKGGVFYSGGKGVYEPCPECNPAAVVAGYYRRMAYDKVKAWVDGQAACEEYNEIDQLFNEVMLEAEPDWYYKDFSVVCIDDKPISQTTDSREAAGLP